MTKNRNSNLKTELDLKWKKIEFEIPRPTRFLTWPHFIKKTKKSPIKLVEKRIEISIFKRLYRKDQER